MLNCKGFVDVEAPLGKLDKRCYGQFIEHLGRCIYGGVWVGEDSKILNVNGFRLDVLEAVKDLKPAIVRWPGGNFSSGYHWLDGVGPRERRPRRFDMAWNSEEPNTFGTDEFIQWCRLVGAEPFIVVNAGNGTPEEAARWVEYCNSSANTSYVKLRQQHGHQEPHGVKVWGIGNELYGKWQIGFNVDGEECARRTAEFANEMRMVDPNIKLVAVGCEDPEWNLDMVKKAGEYFDYLSIHIYIWGPKPYNELVAIPLNIEQRLSSVYSLVQSARQRFNVKREIKLAFDEWNIWYPEAKQPLHHQITNVGDAVFTGGVLNALHRLCNKVPIGGFAQTVNVLPMILTSDEGGMVLTPQYLVFKLYGSGSGDLVVRSVVDSPYYFSSELGEHVPFVDVSATISEDKKTVYLHVVNRHETEPADLSVFFRGFKPKSGSAQCVAGESPSDKNTFEEPNRVKIEKAQVKVEKGECVVSLKPHSVTVAKLQA
ncbi:MAG: alpha-L-arabinofuranosidase C-terminal domain-containing protein [Candidatus Bathyarchaeia archaeon]